MMFDLVCRHSGRRETQHFLTVSSSMGALCKLGMSVVGIAIFAPAQVPQQQAA